METISYQTPDPPKSRLSLRLRIMFGISAMVILCAGIVTIQFALENGSLGGIFTAGIELALGSYYAKISVTG